MTNHNISPSGRTCWIGLRIDEYDGCEWYTTDSKHIEKYWSDIKHGEQTIFIYEAKPGTTYYSRIFKTPKDVNDCFQEEYFDDDIQSAWTKKYELKCSKQNEFPKTYNMTQEHIEVSKNAYQCIMPELEQYVFTLQILHEKIK